MAKKKGSSKNRKEKYNQYRTQDRRNVNNQKSVVKHWFGILSTQLKREIDTRGEANRETYRQLRVMIKENLKNNVLTKLQMDKILSTLTS